VTVAAIEGTLPPAAAAGGPGAQPGAQGVPKAAAAAAVTAATAAVGVLGSVLVDVDGSSSHPVHKDDFAMGGVAMPALTGQWARTDRACLMCCTKRKVFMAASACS
jgi:hypothetical protein